MAEFIVWNLQEDVQKYKKYVENCINKTPYHLTEYLLAEEKAEDGYTKIFLCIDGENFAMFPGVIRRIKSLSYMSDLDEELYDMITPHEYSGIIANNNVELLKQILLENIICFCQENKIIYQFHRINPFMKELPEIYEKAGFDVIHSNYQVYVNLEQTKEQIESGYKSNVRRNVKRAIREGLQFEISEKSKENIAIFQTMYQKAMEILEAKHFLYFNERYFQEIIKCSCSRLCLIRSRDNKVIAASIMLVHENVVYYHLGCFDRNYALQRPMNYLMHSMIMWSKKEGYKVFHLGGGGKSLMQFKEGYSNTRLDYYIANKICAQDYYQRVCENWKKKFPQYADEIFYPQYRYNE